MNNFQVSPNSAKAIVTTAAKIGAPADELVTKKYLQSGCSLPLVITPATADVKLIDWARSNREFLEARLLQEGGILFRNFDLQKAEEFEQLIETVEHCSLGQITERLCDQVGKFRPMV